MSDPCEDICTAVAAWLNDSANFTPSTPIEFTTPTDPNAELELENETLRGLLFPYADEESKIGRGGEVFETFTVSLLVIVKLDDNLTRQLLGGLVREVRAALRGVTQATYRYVTSEIATKFDPEALHLRNQFQSVVRITYMGTA